MSGFFYVNEDCCFPWEIVDRVLTLGTVLYVAQIVQINIYLFFSIWDFVSKCHDYTDWVQTHLY